MNKEKTTATDPTGQKAAKSGPVEWIRKNPLIPLVSLVVAIVGGVAVACGWFNDIVEARNNLRTIFASEPTTLAQDTRTSLTSPPQIVEKQPPIAAHGPIIAGTQITPEPSSPTPSQSPAAVRETVASTMTPAAIMEMVDKVNPMMREDLAKSFIGVPFDWMLELFGSETRERLDGEKYISVAFRSETGRPLVFGELPTERTGELKTVADGEKIRVKGKIKSVSFTSISVNISEFTRN